MESTLPDSESSFIIAFNFSLSPLSLQETREPRLCYVIRHSFHCFNAIIFNAQSIASHNMATLHLLSDIFPSIRPTLMSPTRLFRGESNQIHQSTSNAGKEGGARRLLRYTCPCYVTLNHTYSSNFPFQTGPKSRHSFSTGIPNSPFFPFSPSRSFLYVSLINYSHLFQQAEIITCWSRTSIQSHQTPCLTLSINQSN